MIGPKGLLYMLVANPRGQVLSRPEMWRSVEQETHYLRKVIEAVKGYKAGREAIERTARWRKYRCVADFNIDAEAVDLGMIEVSPDPLTDGAIGPQDVRGTLTGAIGTANEFLLERQLELQRRKGGIN